MLKFIGSGDAFNYRLGNTSAYIKEADSLFLIDCGSTVFARMRELQLLERVRTMTVLITSLKDDHIGSLGSLVKYMFFEADPVQVEKVNVIAPKRIAKKLQKMLNKQGVPQETYSLTELVSGGGEKHFACGVTVWSHEETPSSFSHLLFYQNTGIFYSGETNKINPLAFCRLAEGKIDYFYQDTTSSDDADNPHLPLSTLIKLSSSIPEEYRGRIYCMHIDSQFPVLEAVNADLNIVHNISLQNA